MRGTVPVLHVVRPCGGGMLRHLVDLLRNIDRRRFSPLVAGPSGGELGAVLASLDIRLFPLDLEETWHPRRLGLWQREVSRLIRESGARLVHTHGVRAGLAGRPAAYHAGVPVVATAHNFVYSRPGPRWQKAILSWHQRRLAAMTDCFIAVCQGLARELQLVEKVTPDKVVTIYNGVDCGRLKDIFSSGAPLKIPEGPCIGTIARLIPEKGVDVFLKAAALVARKDPRASFLIIGDGPMRQRLERQADQLGLKERVHFLGTVRNAAAILPRLEVYVQPSRQEGFSLAVLEAMAAALPVVASRTGGLLEAVDPGKNGALVSVGDWHGLAEAIIHLLHHPSTAKDLGRRGLKVVKERFSTEKMVGATQELYSRILAVED